MMIFSCLLFLVWGQMSEIYTALLKPGSSDTGSGDYNVYISNSDDDSDYDIFIEEVSHLLCC